MKVDRICETLDTINEKVGRVICFAVIFIMCIQVLEVILRYVFRNPTIWAWDVNSQLFTGMALLGGGYVLLHDGHVRLDLLYRRVNPRARLVFDLTSFLLIFVALILIIWQGGDMAWTAWRIKERSRSYFSPILWPVKSTLCVGAFFMLLQAISKYMRMIASLRNPVIEGRQVNQ